MNCGFSITQTQADFSADMQFEQGLCSRFEFWSMCLTLFKNKIKEKIKLKLISKKLKKKRKKTVSLNIS